MRIRDVLPGCIGLLLFAGNAAAQSALKDAFKDQFLIGAALNESQFTERDPAKTALIKAQFNSISPENVLKWDATEPRMGEYHFDGADRYVAFGEKNGMFIIGHNLVWHSQVPGSVFTDANGQAVDRETLLGRMRDHIQTVVGRYKGRVNGWDVVNEALDKNGTLRDSPWRKVIGDDYLVKAYQFAHEADPKAELYYNDYGIETGAKRTGTIALMEKLKAAGVPITGIGIQEHVNLSWPKPADVDEAITAFSKLGLKVMVTELDVDVLPSRSHSVSADVGRNESTDPSLNPYPNGLPDDVQQALARRYAELFAVYARHRGAVSRVTFWGVTDGDSWLNNWPIRGRIDYPLLFDRAGHPKPAYDAVIAASKLSVSQTSQGTNPSGK